MSIQLISVSYQYAPLSIRKQFAFSKEIQQQMMETLVLKHEIEECVLVSTCNRTELYCYGNDHAEQRNVFSVMQEALLSSAGLDNKENVSSYLRFYEGQKASHHLFQVASGLDSMVIGEDQKIPVYEALKAVTINAAYAYFEEDSKGSIREGKRADLVILDRNPMETAPMELKDIRVLETIKDGKSIYKAEEK